MKADTLEASLPDYVPQVPEGIPAAVPISDFAEALNMKLSTVKGWVDAGSLPTLPAPSKKRYIATIELAQLEADGWPVNWEKLL